MTTHTYHITWDYVDYDTSKQAMDYIYQHTHNYVDVDFWSILGGVMMENIPFASDLERQITLRTLIEASQKIPLTFYLFERWNDGATITRRLSRIVDGNEEIIKKEEDVIDTED